MPQSSHNHFPPKRKVEDGVVEGAVDGAGDMEMSRKWDERVEERVIMAKKARGQSRTGSTTPISNLLLSRSPFFPRLLYNPISDLPNGMSAMHEGILGVDRGEAVSVGFTLPDKDRLIVAVSAELVTTRNRVGVFEPGWCEERRGGGCGVGVLAAG
jgi:hypothetical protein